MLDKQDFVDFMVESKVLLFGEFITKSGRNTPYFINTGNYTWGNQIQRLGDFYAAAVAGFFGARVTNLFGPAYKGIPIGTAAGISLSQLHNINVTLSFNRKEKKDHGEGGWLLGYEYGKDREDKVVIVEDVTTAGTSIRESLPAINSCKNTSVIGLVVSVDRMEKGQGEKSALQELHEEFGIQTVSLIDFNDILEYLEKKVQNSEFSQELVENMLKYRERYGVEK